MAPVFIFGEQVRSIVRSGKKEIEIPEGARISAAAADMIKEHKIRVKTVAPGMVSSDESTRTEDRLVETAKKAVTQIPNTTPAVEKRIDSPRQNFAEISVEELEEIVDQVINRFNQLKGRTAEKSDPEKKVRAGTGAGVVTDGDDLVICRCEEITRGEIRDAIRNGIQTLNGVKRVTRAGMGLCQGQTCQQLVARILTEELGLSAADIDPTTARGPVRPLRLEVFANS